MNPIATLVMGAIGAFAEIGRAHAAGEIDDAEAVKRFKAAQDKYGGLVDGFALSLADDRRAIDSRIARLPHEPIAPPAQPTPSSTPTVASTPNPGATS